MADNTHRMRLSIDISEFKDHDFTANLYFKYLPLPELNVKLFKSSAIPVTSPKATIFMKECFKAYQFDATKEDLK